MTFHWAHNYGAALQAYALCRFLRDVMKCDVEVINFATDRLLAANDLFHVPSLDSQFHRRLVHWLLELWFFRERLSRHERFEAFVRERFARTRRYRSCLELSASPVACDAVVVGSDQVFNWQILSRDEIAAYCLSTFDSRVVKKVAFAASTGGAADEPRRPSELGSWLRDFHALSVREQSGADSVRTLTGRDVPVVADPVFLLAREQWRELSADVKGIPHDYVLCYALNGRRSLGDIASKVAAMARLPIVLVTDKVRTKIRAEVVVRNAGPREFLKLVDQSQFVVSDSFHGAALAVVFQRPFFSHIALQSAKCRIEQLTRDIGYEDRVICTAEEVTNERLSVNWDLADRFVKRSVHKAFEYLSEALAITPQTPFAASG